MPRKTLKEWCNENGTYGKKFLSEWTGIDEYNNPIDINTVSKGSHNRMQWKCSDCGHHWKARIHSRTADMTECPNCRELSRSKRTRLATTYKGKNDLLTWCNNHGEYGEYLKKEWTGFTTDGKQYEINEIAKGSGIEFLWKCNICETYWPSSPNRRTGKNKIGCPTCNNKSTSYPEQFLYYSLKTIFPDTISRGKFQTYEYDIILPCLNIYIEYSPTYTHTKKTERDFIKAQLCHDNDIRFILIIDDSFNEKEHYVHENEICFKLDYNNKDDSLKSLVLSLLSLLNITDIPQIDFEKVSELAFLRSHNIIEYTDSVEYIFPTLAQEWHTTANGKKIPSMFSPFSSEYIAWSCKNCGYGQAGEWTVSLSNRSYQKSGCPICGYNWYDETIHPSSSSITVIGKNDFPSLHPELFKEWHTSLNSHLNPYNLRSNSHKRVHWECTKCHYGKDGLWNTTISQRIGAKTGCPACGYNCFDDGYHKTSGTSATLPGISDLASQYPRLIKEWNFKLNTKLNPITLKSHSHRKAYWLCHKCGHGKKGEWIARIGDRVRYKSGCPVCGYNWFTETFQKNGMSLTMPGINDIGSSKHKNILSEWHPTLNNQINMNNLRVSSHTEVYWECTKCHYGKNGEWINTLNSRTNQKSGCPVCGYNYFDKTYHKTTGRSTVVVGINDISTTHKEYISEWHPTLNENLKPTQFKAGSHKKIYWVCKKCGYGTNGEWHKEIKARLTQKLHCKYCRRHSKNQPHFPD